MKYILLLGDGMADEPLPELGGKTPLEAARTPHMDRVAREGSCGMLRTIPEGFEAGSDIANLSILGYDPATDYTGRGPLEAASLGIDLGKNDVAYRCNLVTVEEDVMRDFSSGHISSREGAALIGALQGSLPGIRVHAGLSYRNLLVIPHGLGSETTPPHDIVGQPIKPHLPRGGDAPLLRLCMATSVEVFQNHPVNRARKSGGKPMATMVWPWSGGRTPALTPFRTKYGLNGGMISAVDLLKGIARCAQMEVITVPGATGYLDTDFQAKARYALDALRHLDFIYVHVEAPDEAGHLGSIEEKIRAIESFDGVVGTILEHFDGVVAILPDHPTPIRVKTHTRDSVPFAVRGKGTDGCTCFSEREAMKGGHEVLDAREFLTRLFH